MYLNRRIKDNSANLNKQSLGGRKGINEKCGQNFEKFGDPILIINQHHLFSLPFH